MTQTDIFEAAAEAPETIELPALTVPPIKHALGEMRHQLRAKERVAIIDRGRVAISPRVTEVSLHLANGETVLLTSRAKVVQPEGVDGVLQDRGDGTHRWLSHWQIDAFTEQVQREGLPRIVADIRASWTNQFLFRAEQEVEPGDITPGLRPPQLGALHAIGAHWSLSTAPATVVMPTGTGKTETMLATLAAYQRQPILVLVPWDLLRGQTAGKFLAFGLLRELGVLSPTARNPIVGIITKRPTSVDDLDLFSMCNVVVATASALGSGDSLRLAADIATRTGVLIVDEAHHIAASTWTEFRAAFTGRRVLQFTATPFRRDKKLLDGEVIFTYPLRAAQRDGYFKPISFEPVYEIDEARADDAIADAALVRLRADLAAGRDHILMARCRNIDRAKAVFELYRAKARNLHSILVHSETAGAAERVAELRAGRTRIVVCVNMLGEGFDLPQLKVAAVHDMHRSLAILLQFTGRFTRSSGANIGDATVVANIADPDVSGALERLYSEDADWNELLSELSSEAAREHAELVRFLNGSRRLDDERGDEVTISHSLLRPPLSTLTYRATEFHPERFHRAISAHLDVHAVWVNDDTNTLFFVTKSEPNLRWTRSEEMRDRTWALFILHYSDAQKLLYLASTDHSSTFASLASAVSGDIELISGDTIFRVLGHINRLIFQIVGVKKHGRRNLSYANYTGADVATALGLAERAGSVKNNLSGTGWEEGRRVAIGCSYKGRVWSREMGTIPQFVQWSERVGQKLLDDNISTKDIIHNVLIPTEVDELPDRELLSIEWPVELLAKSEERIMLARGTPDADGEPLFLFELAITGQDRGTNTISFSLVSDEDAADAQFVFTLGGPNGFSVRQSHGDAVFISVSGGRLDAYLSEQPPLFRYVDLCELDANMLIHPQDPQELTLPDDRYEAWDWADVNIKFESMWKAGQRRDNSIQKRVADQYLAAEFDVVFDDDGAGEAADLVCLKEEVDHIRLAMIHCKFSGAGAAGGRVKDVVEVCSQAVRSAKWKWRFKDLVRHLIGRAKLTTPEQERSRFLRGGPHDLNRLIKMSRFKEVRAEIAIAQPGLSYEGQTEDQRMVLAAAYTYLKETIGADLVIVCSG